MSHTHIGGCIFIKQHGGQQLESGPFMRDTATRFFFAVIVTELPSSLPLSSATLGVEAQCG